MGSFGFVVFVTAVIGFALVSARAQRRMVSPPMVFVLLGLAAGSGGLGLMGLKIAGEIEEELEVKSGPVKIKDPPDCSGRRVVKIDADGNVIGEAD